MYDLWDPSFEVQCTTSRICCLPVDDMATTDNRIQLFPPLLFLPASLSSDFLSFLRTFYYLQHRSCKLWKRRFRKWCFWGIILFKRSTVQAQFQSRNTERYSKRENAVVSLVLLLARNSACASCAMFSGVRCRREVYTCSCCHWQRRVMYFWDKREKSEDCVL